MCSLAADRKSKTLLTLEAWPWDPSLRSGWQFFLQTIIRNEEANNSVRTGSAVITLRAFQSAGLTELINREKLIQPVCVIAFEVQHSRRNLEPLFFIMEGFVGKQDEVAVAIATKPIDDEVDRMEVIIQFFKI